MIKIGLVEAVLVSIYKMRMKIYLVIQRKKEKVIKRANIKKLRGNENLSKRFAERNARKKNENNFQSFSKRKFPMR